MDKKNVGFVAVISLVTSDQQGSSKDETDLAARFWGAIREKFGRQLPEGLDDLALEQSVERFFPRALHRQLMQHFEQAGVLAREWVTTHPPQLSAVFFKSKIVGYGSLDLEVDVGGIRELISLVGGNLDTFIMMMEAFVPAAFASSLPGPIPPWRFTASVAPSTALRSAFLAPPPEDGEAKKTPVDGHSAKIPKMLVSSALSLLTPVLLSLVVLFFAAQIVLAERSHIAKRESDLVARETSLRLSEDARIASLQQQNIELIKSLVGESSESKAANSGGSKK